MFTKSGQMSNSVLYNSIGSYLNNSLTNLKTLPYPTNLVGINNINNIQTSILIYTQIFTFLHLFVKHTIVYNSDVDSAPQTIDGVKMLMSFIVYFGTFVANTILQLLPIIFQKRL